MPDRRGNFDLGRLPVPPEPPLNPGEVAIGTAAVREDAKRYGQLWRHVLRNERILGRAPRGTTLLSNMEQAPFNDDFVWMTGLRNRGFTVHLVDNAMSLAGIRIPNYWAQYVPEEQTDEVMGLELKLDNPLTRFLRDTLNGGVPFIALTPGHPFYISPDSLQNPDLASPADVVERGFMTSLALRELRYSVTAEHDEMDLHDFMFYGRLASREPPVRPFELDQLMGLGGAMVDLAKRFSD